MTVKLMPVAPATPEEAAPPVKKPRQPRKRRRSAVYDADGHEVLITLKCLKCGRMHPLSNFGLRRMADGAIRNQPWCRDCRGMSSPKSKKKAAPAASVPAEASAEAAPAEAPAPDLVEAPVEATVPAEPAPAPSALVGPMPVVPLTAEQVLRVLLPQAAEQGEPPKPENE